jgi:hypothetical protein
MKKEGCSSICELVKSSCLKNLTRYQNKFGRNTFNFWPTKPNSQWPNSRFFKKIKHFWIPDDLDCSSLSYQFFSTSEFLDFRKHILKYTNHALRYQPKDTFEYYSTWFGKKMKPEFDVCVCINYLIILREKKAALNYVDKSMLEWIGNAIAIFKPENSFELSPNYQKSEIILWHFARLFSTYDTRFKEKKNQLTEIIQNQLKKTSAFNKKIWLYFSLKEIGVKPTVSFSEYELNGFIKTAPYFYAPMLYSWTFLPKSLRMSKLFNVEFYSKSFNALLVLKYKDKYQ